MPTIRGQRWSCHSCGQCCRSLVGHLFRADRDRLAEQGWADQLDAAPYVRVGRGWVLNKRADGACVFLGANGLCRIHEQYGEAAKPLACRIFPFSMRRMHRGWQVSLRFDCPSVAASKGEPIGTYRTWLGELAEQLGRSEKPVPREGPAPPGGLALPDGSVDLQRGVIATPEEVDAVLHRFTGWVGHGDRPIEQRLIGAARVTTTLEVAKLRKVRGQRFQELLGLLFGALSAESAMPPVEATARQRGLLRQLAFAHAEHVSLDDLRGGFAARTRMRWRQLQRSRRFLKGRGVVPRLPGMERDATFDGVESVTGSVDQPGALTRLVERYLCARISSLSVFGVGYYGWSVFRGLSALWLSVAASGWLARYAATIAGRGAITLDDLAYGISVVDRAATRLPALGTMAELSRVRYLLNEDGVARLLRAYTPTGIDPAGILRA